MGIFVVASAMGPLRLGIEGEEVARATVYFDGYWAR